jgi:oligopeptide/dipeptide ABC transporter ATP-binding protein
VSELLRVEELRKSYPAGRGIAPGGDGRIPALDGVSFSIAPGETLALVGESGSGKTTTGRLLLRFEQPDSGRVFFEGEDWLALEGQSLRRRRRDIQIVFQDPQTSLNPRMRVGDQIAEPLRVQKLLARREVSAKVSLLLAAVGLPAAAGDRFPSEFSGGQRQRVAIARALATGPKLLVCDEPVSALDVSVAAQIINLLLELQEKTGLSLLFISHDLAVVERLADRVLVLYRGRVVEEGPTAAIVRRPLHPYTAALLSAAPDPNLSSRRSRIVLPSDTAPARLGAAGCAFQPRCPVARPRCQQEAPPLEELELERRASCFFPGELQVKAGEPLGPPLGG